MEYLCGYSLSPLQIPVRGSLWPGGIAKVLSIYSIILLHKYRPVTTCKRCTTHCKFSVWLQETFGHQSSFQQITQYYWLSASLRHCKPDWHQKQHKPFPVRNSSYHLCPRFNYCIFTKEWTRGQASCFWFSFVACSLVSELGNAEILYHCI